MHFLKGQQRGGRQVLHRLLALVGRLEKIAGDESRGLRSRRPHVPQLLSRQLLKVEHRVFTYRDAIDEGHRHLGGSLGPLGAHELEGASH